QAIEPTRRTSSRQRYALLYPALCYSPVGPRRLARRREIAKSSCAKDTVSAPVSTAPTRSVEVLGRPFRATVFAVPARKSAFPIFLKSLRLPPLDFDCIHKKGG